LNQKKLHSFLNRRAKTKSDINEHLKLLHKIVVKCKAKRIVELGTRGGNSTCALVIGAAETGGHVISVDSGKGDEYTGDPPAWEALTGTSSVITDELGLGKFWTLVLRDDIEFAKEYHDEIDLLFIDTSHSYVQTKKELEAWGSKVVEGGFIIVHDTVSFPEQNRAIWEYLCQNPLSDYAEHENCNGLGIIIKDTRRPRRSRVQGARADAMSRFWSDRVARFQESISQLRTQLRTANVRLERRLEDSTRASDPLGTLLQIYWMRSDLQNAFPEVRYGEYPRLIEWARNIVGTRSADVHLDPLLRFTDWFAGNPWRWVRQETLDQYKDMELELPTVRGRVSELERKNAQLESRVSDLRTKLSELEVTNSDLRSQLSSVLKQSYQVASELDAIHRSSIFRIMSFFAKRLDRLLPDRTRRGEFRKIIVRSTHIVLDEGITSLVRQMCEKIAKREFRIMEPTALGASSTEMAYEKLLASDELDQERVEKIKEDIATFKLTPKVSIITPTYNTPIQHLRTTLESVRDQLYGNWELCVCDDGSDDAVWELLRAYERKDARIKLARMKENSGTAKASNKALKLATGEFVALLDHDDVLTRDALYEFVRAINTEPDADVIYSDEDKITEDGRCRDPFFKPDWSPELLRTIPYISHLTVIRKSLVENAGGFREEFRDTPDYDLQLRTTDLARKVVHIPRVLYHWRVASTSVSNPENRTKFERLCKENLAELQRFASSKKMGRAETWTYPNTFHIAYTITGKPRVTIVILTYDKVDLLRNCLESIEKSSYPHKEIVIVTNNVDKRSEMWAYLRTLPHKVIKFEAEFNWSAMNNRAAEVASGDYLLFLNDDTEVKNNDWIEKLLEYAQQPDVGAVGCRLIRPDGRSQHAGVTSDPIYIARHQFKEVAGDGYYSMTVLSREVSAVTGACMITRTQVFQQLHGFDTALRHLYNDIDYCWRLRDLGYRIVYAATVTLLHHEGGSRYGKLRQGNHRYHNDPSEMRDVQHMFRRCRGKMLNGDPYFNYNLNNVGIDLFGMTKSFHPSQQPTSPSGAILLLSHNLNLEGSTLGLFNIGRYLRQIGYVVTVVSPHDGKLRRRYVENGISVLIIPDLGHLCSRGDEDLRAFMASYDLIFANTILMFFVIPFVRARSYPATPRIVWIIRESPEIDDFCRQMGTGINTLTYCFANADKVVFLCKATLDLYAQFNTKDNFQVINDSVDWDEYQKLAKSPSLHLDKSFFNVLTVGTIYSGKGQDMLVEAALDLLARKDQNFKFYIVGKVGNEEFFKKLKSVIASRQLDDRIIFTGQLNRRDLISYYTECQTFVLPSRRESFPTAVVEAMAAGKPIIATRVFGIMEQLQHNYSGLLIEPDDKSGLVESLLRLYHDPAFAATLGENARREFISRFTLRAMTEKYRQLVQSLTSDTSRSLLPTVTVS
jgi:GT2 family glycosyltransferase/glycosyltransferase involved in cell wall biosynthesis/predicted O-methyltransferase YrrM